MVRAIFRSLRADGGHCAPSLTYIRIVSKGYIYLLIPGHFNNAEYTEANDMIFREMERTWEGSGMASFEAHSWFVPLGTEGKREYLSRGRSLDQDLNWEPLNNGSCVIPTSPQRSAKCFAPLKLMDEHFTIFER